jgi:hypothetical protein
MYLAFFDRKAFPPLAARLASNRCPRLSSLAKATRTVQRTDAAEEIPTLFGEARVRFAMLLRSIANRSGQLSTRVQQWNPRASTI